MHKNVTIIFIVATISSLAIGCMYDNTVSNNVWTLNYPPLHDKASMDSSGRARVWLDARKLSLIKIGQSEKEVLAITGMPTIRRIDIKDWASGPEFIHYFYLVPDGTLIQERLVEPKENRRGVHVFFDINTGKVMAIESTIREIRAHLP